jgi:hypothetical protein
MSVKNLGVILDSQMTWKERVDVKVRKAQNLMWACRRACGMTWGLGPRVVHWLYVSISRPTTVTFASLVWWPGCKTANAKKKLSKIQRLACLGITGAMCTIPTSAVGALICLPPTGVCGAEEGKVNCASSLESGVLVLPIPQQRTSSILMWLQQLDPFFTMEVDVMRPAFNFEPKYRVTMLTRED